MNYEVLRPLSEWQEDDGDVLWYRVPIHEPPFVSSPLRSDWLVETANGRCIEVEDSDEDEPKAWATHWCHLPRVLLEPQAPSPRKRLEDYRLRETEKGLTLVPDDADAQCGGRHDDEA